MPTNDTAVRMSPAAIEALSVRLTAIAADSLTLGPNRVVAGLDGELALLGERYAAAARVDADGAWIPISDALAKGLLTALPDRERFSICQVVIDGEVQRWEVGGEYLLCRVVVESLRGLKPCRPGRFLVSRGDLEARVGAPASTTIGEDWLQGGFAPVAATAVTSPNSEPPKRAAQDGWMDVDAALASLPVGESSKATIGSGMLRDVGRVAAVLGGRIDRDGWRSEHHVRGAPWVLRCSGADPNTGIQSVAIYAMPWGAAPKSPLDETAAPATVEVARQAVEPVTEMDPLPLVIHGQPGDSAGVVTLSWSRMMLSGCRWESVVQSIAVELAKRKLKASPMVIWAWSTTAISHGPAVSIAVTPFRTESAETLARLCRAAAPFIVNQGAGALEEGAEPVLIQSAAGSVLRVVHPGEAGLEAPRFVSNERRLAIVLDGKCATKEAVPGADGVSFVPLFVRVEP